ncbi:MAG TPA: hypothetical protein VLM42_06710 [Bryobacteraceae bacterium]|nr:hypothetical protein [Bryobacteraceae bacterium]
MRIICGVAFAALFANAQTAPPDLAGVYRVIERTVTLPSGLKNAGSPVELPLLAEAATQTKSVDLKQDPAKMCVPIGPFRMMAREENKIELVPVKGKIVMLFEDLSRGVMRTIYLNRGHPEKRELTWMGDSIGRWDGNTLVVDTVGFNDRTWFNDAGAQHSDALHLVERIRPVLEGKYLEYKVTAEDTKTLAKPYTYTRYYEKLKTEIQDDVCEDEK